MKVTHDLIRRFEKDQQRYGTRTALFNLLWQKASDDLRDLGVTRLRTEDDGEPVQAVDYQPEEGRSRR